MNSTNAFGKAVLYTIVICAITHLSVSLFASIWHGNTSYINMFHVLGLDLIWPELGKGTFNAVLGVVVTVAAWGAIGSILLWRDVRADKQRVVEHVKHKKKA